METGASTSAPSSSLVPPTVSDTSATVFSILKDRYQFDKSRGRILDVIQLHLHQNGQSNAINQTPLINGNVIDLSSFFLTVAGRGGFTKVNASNGWGEIATKLGYDPSIGNTLQDVYSKVFLSFERQLALKKSQATAAAAAQSAASTTVHMPPAGGSSASTGFPSQTPFNIAPAASRPVPMSASLKQSKKRDRQQLLNEANDNSVVLTEKVDPLFLINKKKPDKALFSECLADITSNNMNSVVRGLNMLSIRSAEVEHRAVNIEPFPFILVALGDLLDIANPLVGPYFDTLMGPNFDILQFERRGIDWSASSPAQNMEVCFHALDISITHFFFFNVRLQPLDDSPLLLTCLNIIRNLSFEASNEALIAHSAKIISHTAFLLQGPSVAYGLMPECVAYAFDILTNIGKSIDMSGRKRKFLKDCWMVDVIDQEEDKELLMARCSSHYSVSSTDVYVTATYSIFPRLACFMESNEREYVLKAVECFGHLCQAEENVELINSCPLSLPKILVELLCVSTTNSDPLTTSVPCQDPSIELSSKPQALTCAFADQCDIAIRDFALYALYMLVCLSLKWRRHLPSVHHALNILRRIAMSQARTENSLRAGQILSVMTMDVTSKTEYLRQQSEFCVAACSDDHMQEVVFSATGNNFFTNNSTKVSGINNSAGGVVRIRWG